MTNSKERFAHSYLLYGLIRGLNFVIENDIRKDLKKIKMNFSSFRILWILYFYSNINISELTYLTQTNISNVTRQLTKLKEEGMVLIKIGHDARAKELSLTEDGQRVVYDFIKRNEEDSEIQLTHLVEKISENDFATFVGGLSVLSNELLGKNFNEFVKKSSAELLNKSASTQ
ncbi:MarR family winged helix-turn-helix transcriptional regulator [Oceanobacillus halophilus]|uniref:MarR family transcriptional regulator n=1 Tax=Oceanobacillus halophilus TaxID=930130 RepID=A0A495A7X2_9BACI|nr:MarR family transcriptional regulator [Oceanobacillus halophilus]RKQ34575.1 MarR family transcriptional regulator [Oceanobacillus halophilus]